MYQTLKHSRLAAFARGGNLEHRKMTICQMTPSNKLNELEGLRGIASFGVLISHSMGAGIVPVNIWRGKFHMLVLSGITDGFLCVIIFWIMSAVALS
jgi:peptidoglycan/LPS O-acetylase OafA/YrhL